VFEVSESKVTDVRCTNIKPNSVSGLQQHKSVECRIALLACMTVQSEDIHHNRLDTLRGFCTNMVVFRHKYLLNAIRQNVFFSLASIAP
jgi:hypothetical protein